MPPDIAKCSLVKQNYPPSDCAGRSGLETTDLDPALHCTGVQSTAQRSAWLACSDHTTSGDNRCPGGTVFVDTSSPCCYEGVNTVEHTPGTEPTQTRQSTDRHSRPHPIPVRCPSHLLSIFSKCSQLLSLFRLLHGGLLSLQFLSNLKHKMLSAYVNWKWRRSCLGCTAAGSRPTVEFCTLWSSKETSESSTPSPVFYTQE